MTDLLKRAEAAVAAWKSGAITHSLHVELAALVEEFHRTVSAGPAIAPESIEVAIPPKEAAPE